MPIQVTCAGCQTRYNVPDTMQGKQARCKKCNNLMAIAAAPPGGPAPRPNTKSPPPAAPAGADAPAPERKGSGLKVAVVAVLILGILGAGAAAWFLLGPGKGESGKSPEVAKGDTAAEPNRDLAKETGKELPPEVPNPDKSQPPDVSKIDPGKQPDPSKGKIEPKQPEPLLPAKDAKIGQPLYDRVQLGMTLEQAESILGKGKPIGVNDLPPANGPGPDKVRAAGQQCKVGQWFQWGQIDHGIFAGFTKLDDGPERATVAAFRTADKIDGIPVVNYPNKSAVAPGPVKMPRPRIPGNYAEMLVGQWHEKGYIQHEFRADGSYDYHAKLHSGAHKGTYKFIDNETFEVNPGGGAGLPTGKRSIAFFSKDEMRLDLSSEALDRENAATQSFWRVFPEPTTGIRVLPALKGATLSLAFTPDGKTLVTGAGTNSANGEQGEIKLWDVATGEEKPFLTKPTHNLTHLALSADGKVLATAAFASVKIWNLESATEVRTIKVPGINHVYLTADGKSFATDAKGVTLFDVASGAEQHSFKHRNAIYSMALSPDGKMVAWRDPATYLGDVEAKKVIFSAKTNTLGGMAFSPDGATLAMCANMQGDIRLMDVASKKSLALLKGHLADIRSMAFTADGKTLVSGGLDCTAKVWDVQTGKVRASYTTYDRPIHALAVSPDGKMVALGNNDTHTVRLWDISTASAENLPAGQPAPPATVDAKPPPQPQDFRGLIVGKWELVKSECGGVPGTTLEFTRVKVSASVPNNGPAEEVGYAINFNVFQTIKGTWFQIKTLNEKELIWADRQGKTEEFKRTDSLTKADPLKPDPAKPEPPKVEPTTKPPTQPPPLAKTDPPKSDPATKTEMPAKPSPEDMKPFLGVWTFTGAGALRETWTFKEDNGQLTIATKYDRGGQEVGSFSGKDIKVAKGQVTFTSVFEKKPVASWADTMVIVVPVGDRLKFSWGPGGMDGSNLLSRASTPAPTGQPAGVPMDSVVGKWKWFDGRPVIAVADGTFTRDDKKKAGTWKVVDSAKGQYQFRWDSGFIDDLTLSADGKQLDGKNQVGSRVTATRDAELMPPAGNRDPLVGNWKWFDGSMVTVTADGAFARDGKRAGTWKAMDASKRQYQLTWTARKFMDDLTLSADSKQLDGKNQFGQRVTGTKTGD